MGAGFLESQTSIVMVSAHPDDAEIYAGGVAALARERDIPVTFLIMTDGRIGATYDAAMDALDLTRYKEQVNASMILGVEHHIMMLRDGYLEPTADNRHELILMLRLFKPSLIFTHRLTSGHPDHRATAQMVIDAMPLMDKKIIIDAEPCPKPHVLLYWDDKPPEFRQDIVVDVSRVLQKKQAAINAHASQREKYGACYPTEQAEEWGKGTKYKYVEGFEISPYGRSFENWNTDTLIL